MFYCDICADKRRWPNWGIKSFGVCEICNETALCNEVPSRDLPYPQTEGGI